MLASDYWKEFLSSLSSPIRRLNHWFVTRWAPGKPLPPSDIAGRRLSPKDVKRGKPGEKSHIRLSAFIDKRLHTDLSFDVLGTNSCDKTIVRCCAVHARDTFAIRTITFEGWAAIKVRLLQEKKLAIFSRPVIENGRRNDYHSELSRWAYKNRESYEALAYQLQTLANQSTGFVEAPAVPNAGHSPIH